MQISIKGYITSKKSEQFYDCADRYAYDKSQFKFAISDGVSKSFFPKIWADVLVHNWVEKQWSSAEEFIENCQKKWLGQVTEIATKPDAKWFTKNAFNRKEAGMATFVGLQFDKNKDKWIWKANALGDSFLFFVPENCSDFSKDCIILSSKKEPIIFDNFPDYLSSIGAKHNGEKEFKTYTLISGTFYLMTDALAEWFLNEKNNAISKIDVWQNQKDFERFVDEERHNKKLGNDDSAILTIKLEEDKKEQLTFVLEEVTDINELIKVQQKEIEVSEKVREQELILQEENSNSEKPLEQIKHIEAEIEKAKKGIIEKGKELFFGKREKEQSAEQDEPETDERVEVKEERQEEKGPSTQGEENNIEIENLEDSENNKSQESESKSKEVPESNIKTPNKHSQNITDKF